VKLSNMALYGDEKDEGFVKWFYGMILDGQLCKKKGKTKIV